jgi:recombinational DNA repair ATPase RecF
MSIIEKLSVTAVRNIDGLDIEPIPTVNILHGENGSGKTSILESISTKHHLILNHIDILLKRYFE